MVENDGKEKKRRQRSLKLEMFNGDLNKLPFLRASSFLPVLYFLFIFLFAVILGWSCLETSELIADQLSVLSLLFSFFIFLLILSRIISHHPNNYHFFYNSFCLYRFDQRMGYKRWSFPVSDWWVDNTRH